MSSFAERLKLAKPVGGKGPKEQRSPGVSDDAIAPVPESRPGIVNAYRGTEQHGINVTAGTGDAPYEREPFRKDIDVEITPGIEYETPVLVRVVTDGGAEVRDWRVITTVIGATPGMILNRLDSRTVARITNEGAATIRVGRDASLNVNNSFPLAAGQTLADIRHTQEVWAISADGSSCNVSALVEYSH